MNLNDKIKQMKMLVIDNDQWIRDSLSLYFENEGCHLFALETAEEGINAIKKDKFDIFIVDYRLPGMDGLDFFNRIKESNPDVVKILITAHGTEDIVARAMEMDVHEVINKPFSTDEIKKVLSRVIDKQVQQI